MRLFARNTLVVGIVAISTTCFHGTSASEISDCEHCSADEDTDTFSMVQNVGLKSMLHIRDVPLNDWDKEFITDDQSGPFFDSDKETTTKAPVIAQVVTVVDNETAREKGGEKERKNETAQEKSGEKERKNETAQEKSGEKERTNETAQEKIGEKERKNETAQEKSGEKDRKIETAQEKIGEEKKDYTKVFFGTASSSIVAAILLAVVFIFALLLCAVQLPAEAKEKTPLLWYVLSNFIAVFLAALISTTMRDLLTEFSPVALLVNPTYKNSALLGGVFLMLHFMLFVTRRNFWLLEGIGSIGAFLLGFAAAQTLAYVQQQPTLLTSWFVMILTVLGCTMIVLLVIVCLNQFRLCTQANEGSSRFLDLLNGRSWVQWHGTCKETEVVAASVALGHIFCKAITYAILGNLTPAGTPTPVIGAIDAIFLAVVAVGIAVVLLFTIKVQMHRDLPSGLSDQVESLVLYTLGMTSSWCMFTVGQWVFWDGMVVGAAQEVSARLLSAMVFLAGVLLVLAISIGVLGVYGERGKYLQVITSSMAMLLGLAFEAFFARAALGYGRFVQCCLCMALCLLVLPAWGAYILPNAVHKPWLVERAGVLVEEVLQGGEKGVVGSSAGLFSSVLRR